MMSIMSMTSTSVSRSRVKCPACNATKKTHAFQLKADCPWCAHKGHVSLETERAFHAVKRLIPHEFTIIFGGYNPSQGQQGLDAWLAKRNEVNKRE